MTPQPMVYLAMLPLRQGGWLHYLAVLLLLCALWSEVRVLWMEYYPANLNRKKGNADHQQRPGQINNALGGNFGKLGSGNKNLRVPSGNLGNGIVIGWINVRNLLAKPVNGFLKFLGFSHDHNG